MGSNESKNQDQWQMTEIFWTTITIKLLQNKVACKPKLQSRRKAKKELTAYLCNDPKSIEVSPGRQKNDGWSVFLFKTIADSAFFRCIVYKQLGERQVCL